MGDGTAPPKRERERETRYSHESGKKSEGHLSQDGREGALPGIHPSIHPPTAAAANAAIGGERFDTLFGRKEARAGSMFHSDQAV